MPTDDVEAVIERELALLTPQVRGSAARLDDLLAPDFVEIGASGRRWTRDELIAVMVAETTADRPVPEYSEMSGRIIGPGLVLLTYVSEVEGRRARRSSLWRRSAEGWQVLHHQGTPSRPSTDELVPSRLPSPAWLIARSTRSCAPASPRSTWPPRPSTTSMRCTSADVVQPPHDTEFGAGVGSSTFTTRDPEGNLWTFGTYRGAA